MKKIFQRDLKNFITKVAARKMVMQYIKLFEM